LSNLYALCVPSEFQVYKAFFVMEVSFETSNSEQLCFL
jgi:hypothetical protein